MPYPYQSLREGEQLLSQIDAQIANLPHKGYLQ